jgi:Fic family protein
VILFELTANNEDHPAYQALAISNGKRQFDFLRSVVVASIEVQRPFLSQTIIKGLNYQAIACLHTNAGEYRPCRVTVGSYEPPEHYRVQALMDDFVNDVNWNWVNADAVNLASFVLWRMNHIHPFINGNGRTARAACYFVLCVKSGGWIGSETILPELIKRNRPEYVRALQHADATYKSTGRVDLAPLHGLLSRLLSEQLGVAASGDNGLEPPASE